MVKKFIDITIHRINSMALLDKTIFYIIQKVNSKMIFFGYHKVTRVVLNLQTLFQLLFNLSLTTNQTQRTDN